MFTRNVGDYIIVRADSAGVFAGEFLEQYDSTVVLTNARRLWYWSGANSLSQLAMEGVKRPLECKFPVAVTRVEVRNVCEILDVTDAARKNIEAVPVWSFEA